MEEQKKIETQSKTYRLPVDVIELLERWSEETKQTPTQVLANVLRTAAEDENRVLQGVDVLQKKPEDVLQADSVLQVAKPRSRDELADTLTAIMHGTSLGANDKISALGVTRARVYKLTPEYQAARKIEPYSVYEDEKRLADDLSKSGGAGNYTPKMREKSEK